MIGIEDLNWLPVPFDTANASAIPFGQKSVQALPAGNGTHRSNETNASFVFQFAGTSILVSGINPSLEGGSTSGVPSMSFDLDGNSTTQSFFTVPGGSNEGMHFVYYQNDALSAGNHTLNASIQYAEGPVAAYVDYITYEPSFAVIAGKPDFQPGPSTSSPVSATSHSDAGVIAGVTVSGTLLLLGLVIGWWFIRKKRSFMARTAVEPFKPGPTSHQPFIRSKHEPVEPYHLSEGAESTSGSSDTGGEQHPEGISIQIQEIQTQLGQISREITQYLVPPDYNSNRENQ